MHRHVWKIVAQVEHPSPLEQMRESGAKLEFYLPWVFERDVIVTRRCDTCGTEKIGRV